MSYQDAWMPVIHDVVTEPRAGVGDPAPAEPLVEAREPIGELDPYQAVQPGNRRASGSQC